MPPRTMFKEKLRLSGLEFGSCRSCNGGTSAADLVASFVARLDPDGSAEDWLFREAIGRTGKLRQMAPEVLREIFRTRNEREVWHRNAGGILERKVRVRANGPFLSAYLNVFAAKMGMALYREHAGSALPLDGVVQAHFFLNAGLAQETADTILRVLPVAATLQQSKQTASGQFAYRYNSDGKSIVAALAQFHRGLYTFTIASGEPVYKRAVEDLPDHRCAVLARPGQLVGLMPGPVPGLSASGIGQVPRKAVAP